MSSKSSRAAPLLFSCFSTVLIIIACMLVRGSNGYASTLLSSPTDGSAIQKISCVVIDAGHGGEDCGAVSADGLLEKDVNLAVAFALRDLLEMNGISVVMTRDEDILLYDRNVDYQGRKKVLDLAARKAVADQCGDCLFVSIHMNAFPQTQYSGVQVWYGSADPRSQSVASNIQNTALRLQPDNRRKIKAADSSIYLLDKISAPCVLVECGFLSNPEEAAMLADPSYQYALALMIFSGICPYVAYGNA